LTWNKQQTNDALLRDANIVTTVDAVLPKILSAGKGV